MKKFLLPFLLVHLAVAVNAATYYFSSGSGDDSRTSTQAQNSGTPWKTIAKLNAIMSTLKPGDMVLFKRGESFDGAITVTVSGASGQPITFGAYGSGNKPIINGFSTLAGWTQARNNVWEASLAPSAGSTNMVIRNDKQMAIGRYPNTNAANHGFLTVDSHSGGTQITSSGLQNSPSNWNGGEVVIRKIRWVLDRNTITSHNGNTLNFIAGSGYNPSDKWGFFIQNHTNTLDQDGEWYYDNNRKKLQMYFSGNNPNAYTVKASVVPVLVSISYKNYITFNNLIFNGANSNVFSIIFSNNITISACNINFSGGNCVTSNNSNNFTLVNSTISNTNNNAIHLQYNCANAIIRNNKIKNTAVIPGMGQNDANSYQAIYTVGSNNIIEYNQVDSIGYNGIHFEGENATVKNNLINTFDFIKDDGAGIYTGQGAYDNTVYSSRLVTGNIILNGIGATAGTDDTTYTATNGIYLDDNTNHVTVTGNTIANCGHAGIFNHNARDIVISNNTMYNNTQEQLLVVRDYIVSNPVRNVTISNNIMFSKTASQLANNVTSVENDIRQFGNFNNNYYCRPIDNNYLFFDAYYTNGQLNQQYNNLQGWQSKYSFDLNSSGAPVTIPSFTLNSLIGSNKYSNGYYNANIYEVYTFSPTNDINTSWNPSKLDGGTLQVTANNFSSSNDFLINMPIGKVTAGKSYSITFSLMGNNSKKAIDVFLRKTGWPYTELTPRSKVPITTNRTEYKFGYTATASDDAACILFEVDQPDAAMWIDNVVVQEANMTITNPDDYIVFQYNASKKNKSYKLPAGVTYYDAAGKIYVGSLVLAPFASAVLIKQTSLTPFTTSTDAAQQAISLDGSLKNATNNLVSATTADLSWQVDNQNSNATYYEIERSADGNNFTTVGSTEVKEGAATATYQYSDAKPLAGKNYYRVKQYDEKGAAFISKVVMVNNIGFRLNPNPAHDVLHLLFDQAVTADDHMGREIVIRSTSGAVVKTIAMSGGTVSKVDIDVSNFAAGMYILSLSSEGKIISKPFLKQ